MSTAQPRQRIGAAIGARDLRWISGYISVKDAFSPPLWWHQDWWCWSHPISFTPALAQVAVACYLTETTADPLRRHRRVRDLDRRCVALDDRPGEAMKRVPVQSSALRSVGHDPGTGILEVEFVSGDVYQYLDVDPLDVERLLNSGSMGAYVNQHIKQRYSYVYVGTT